MKRISSVGLGIALASSLAAAQPKDGGKPSVPVVPAGPAEAPIAPEDPYGDATPPAKAVPAKPAPAKPAKRPPAKPAKPAPAATAPEDPYADSPLPPVEKPDPFASPRPAPTPVNPPAEKPDPFAAPRPAPTVIPAAAKRPVKPAPPEPTPVAPAPVVVAQVTPRVSIADLASLQGLLAVQRLDGWLLFDRDGNNPLAARVVHPEGNPARPWFYLVPAKGDPILLAHASELRSFDHLAGKKLVYASYADLDKQLKVMLKGVRTIAAEYSEKGAVPSVSRIDAGTLERIRATGVKVKPSDALLQVTEAIWGEAGRMSHFVAVHHLAELRKDALAYVTKAIQAGQAITEYDVQQRLVRGLKVRGLESIAPVVAAGVNTADPYYVPTAAKAAPIKRGDLLVLALAAKEAKPDGVWAAQTWVAVVDATVPDAAANAFAATVAARDRAIALITERAQKHRPVTGAEVDLAARGVLQKAGYGDKLLHRTGHSIDNDLQGSGTDLDSFELKDTRILTTGTGVAVGPGVYVAGQFGVRTEVSVYLGGNGPEVTTEQQATIQPLLAR